MVDNIKLNPKLPDLNTLLNQSWTIVKKYLLFFLLASSPLAVVLYCFFVYVLQFDMSDKINLDLLYLIFGIYIFPFILLSLFCSNAIFLYLSNPAGGKMNSVITALTRYSKTIMSYFGPRILRQKNSIFSGIIFLLEDETLDLADAKSCKYVEGYDNAISNANTIINCIFGLSVLSILIAVPLKFLEYNGTLTIICSAVFILSVILGFIFRTVFIFNLYITVKNLHLAPDTSSQIIPEKSFSKIQNTIHDDKFDSFITKLSGGRLNRREFWLGNTILVVISFVLVLLILVYFVAINVTAKAPNAISEYVIAAVFALPMLLETLCLLYFISFQIRRLHDLDKNGWFFFLTFIPIFGLFISLYIAFAEGMKEKNRFGDPVAEIAVKDIFCLPGH